MTVKSKQQERVQKMSIKMIATDMDGTLLDERGQLDRERLTGILDALDQRQIRFVVATGNEIARMQLLMGDLLERVSLVAANGARIFEGGQLIQSSYWQPELVLEVLDHFSGSERDLHLVVTSDKGSFALEGTGFPIAEKVMTQEMAQYFYKRMNFVRDLSLAQTDIVLKMSLVVAEEEAAALTDQINRDFPGRLSAVTSGYGAIDIIQAGVHKAWGLEQLMERWQIGPGEIMAFGDSANDAEMLELAGHSYAMDNAEEDLKRLAKRLAPSNGEAGVFRVLEDFLAKEG